MSLVFGAAAGGAGFFVQLMPLFLIFIIFWFFLIRPQQKRQKEHEAKIAAVTEAGGPISKNTEWWTKTLLNSLRPYDLSYVLVWRNPFNQPADIAFGPYKNCPSEQDFQKFHADQRTLFLKDIK